MDGVEPAPHGDAETIQKGRRKMGINVEEIEEAEQASRGDARDNTNGKEGTTATQLE